MELVERGDGVEMLSASANSTTDPGTRDLSARFQSGVLRLVGSLDDRPLRTRRHDDAGQGPDAAEASIGHFAELIARAVVAGYRDQQDSRAIGDGRPFSIESLLDGAVVDEWTLWEVANQLRLPTSGPFVVVAAEVSSVGSEALPGSNRSCAALTCIQPGGCCPICTWASCTSTLSRSWTKCWRWCLGWPLRPSA